MPTIQSDAAFKRFPSGLLVCALLVASGLVWAMMFFAPLTHLSCLAEGVSPFDIRPMGYSYDEAYAFLNAIGKQGRRYWPIASWSSICSCDLARVGAVVADDTGAPARYSYAAQLALRPHYSPDHHGGP
jgi:hypothetical protein